MSIIKEYFNDFKSSINRKEIKNLKKQQSEIINLNYNLIELNSEIQKHINKVLDLNKNKIRDLEQKSIQQKSSFAQTNGFKSASQYKLKLKSDISKNEEQLKNLKQKQEKYSANLKNNQDKLKRIDNALIYYNNVLLTTILSFLISLIVSSSFIVFAVIPKHVFENTNIFILYSSVFGSLVLSASLVIFFCDKSLYKKFKLENHTPVIIDYIFSIILILNIIFITMPITDSKNYITLVFYIFLMLYIFYILIKNEIKLKKEKNYNFPLDFTFFNLPFINFTVITLLNLFSTNNYNTSLAIKIFYTVGVFIYLILFIWDAITRLNLKNDFKQYLFLILSLLLLLIFILCAVLNFIPDFYQAIEFIASIGGILGLFNFLFQGIRKSSNNKINS